MMALPRRVLLLLAFAALTTLSHAAPSPSPQDDDSENSASDWHGFNDSCQSWHTEPSADGAQILLVARCYNDGWGASRSDADIMCSQLDLNECIAPLPGDWNWLYELGPKQAADDKKFFPSDCSQVMIDTGPTSATTSTETNVGTICNKIGEAGTVHGSVDIAPAVANWNGYLGCVGVTGKKSTLCR